MNPKIDWISTNNLDISDPKNVDKGGTVYNHQALKVLNDRFSLRFVHLPKGVPGGGKSVQAFHHLSFLLKMRALRSSADVVVRDPYAVAFSGAPSTKNKNIVLVHHVSEVFGNRNVSLFLKRFLEKVVQHDVVVTVSEFWKNYFEKLGCPRVLVIYNSFGVDDFQFSNDELAEFKARHGIRENSRVVYIGSSAEGKGGRTAVESLRDSGFFLVASGDPDPNLPVFTKRFSYRDYLRLLCISDAAVLMSEFNEGWNRTAHEAMLCGTPVVGSGSGGMGELLEGGGQVVCRDVAVLPEKTRMAIDQRTRIGLQGQAFARQFDHARFEGSWTSLIESLTKAGANL